LSAAGLRDGRLDRRHGRCDRGAARGDRRGEPHRAGRRRRAVAARARRAARALQGRHGAGGRHVPGGRHARGLPRGRGSRPRPAPRRPDAVSDARLRRRLLPLSRARRNRMTRIRRMVSGTIFPKAALAAVAVGLAGAAWWLRPTAERDAHAHWALLDRYCTDCHNEVDYTADIAFDRLTPDAIAAEPALFEEVVRKLRGRMMPPPGASIPTSGEYDGFVGWLEGRLDAAAAASPNPGRVVLHRLNRTEYQNTIRDLLALDVDASDLLPKDDESEGFDNVANVLKLSPSFLDQYIAAARLVS